VLLTRTINGLSVIRRGLAAIRRACRSPQIQ